MKTVVKMSDGSRREFPRIGDSEWYRGVVEGNGCLTIYRMWDGGVCYGRAPEASYAPGTWREWSFESDGAPT